MTSSIKNVNYLYLIAKEYSQESSNSSTLVRFNLTNGTCKVMKKYKRYVTLIAVSDDANYLVVAGENRFDILNLIDGKERQR